MHEYHNPHTNERYTVRAVPVDEAIKLREQGAVFYDNTKLVAVNTCPTFGVLRYAQHRTEHSIGGRNLALEAGSACHEYFAAIRMWTLLKKEYPNLGDLVRINLHGEKLFGVDRWKEMLAVPQDGDPISNAHNFAAVALHTSGYYNDPSDNKRTIENMEVACVTYTHRYFQSELPVYVNGDFIGVEVPFVVEIKRIAPWKDHPVFETFEQTYYYCGRIDGVHHYGSTLTAGENKTASRPDAVWRSSFHMSSQVTGYNVALSSIIGAEISDALIMGLQIPVPTRDIYSGVAFESVSRTLDDKLRWFEWFFHSVSMYEQYSDPTLAPRYTHSCNRYFSICQFLPFCTMTRTDQKEAIEQMRVDIWSPLDHLMEKKDADIG